MTQLTPSELAARDPSVGRLVAAARAAHEHVEAEADQRETSGNDEDFAGIRSDADALADALAEFDDERHQRFWSVLLAYPDYCGGDADTFFEWTEAATAEEAVANVRAEAMSNVNDGHGDDPDDWLVRDGNDFAVLAVMRGHVEIEVRANEGL